MELKRSTAVASEPSASLRGSALFSSAQWEALAVSMRLSVRELQIVRCVFDGNTEGAIAERLAISPHTVHTYLLRVYQKLSIRSREGLLVRVFAGHLAVCFATGCDGSRQRGGKGERLNEESR